MNDTTGDFRRVWPVFVSAPTMVYPSPNRMRSSWINSEVEAGSSLSLSTANFRFLPCIARLSLYGVSAQNKT